MFKEEIKKSLKILEKEQKDDGSFSDYAWTAEERFERDTTFSTALILDIISQMPEQFMPNIKNKAVDFLLSQKSKNSTYNYWKRGSVNEKEVPYPDDLDDTSCSLAAIFKCGKVFGDDLANFVNILMFLELGEGGPYFTWVVPKEKTEWKDIDLAVNSNIAYFLSLNEVNLPNVEKMIEGAIEKNRLTSPYYVSKMAVPYFISRFYIGKRKDDLIHIIESKIKTNLNVLDRSLAVTALINLGYERDLKNEVLLIKNSKWEELPFVLESNREKEIWSGSKALTTAFCLEAIFKYESSLIKPKSEENEVFSVITQLFKKRIELTNDKLLNYSSEQIDELGKSKTAINSILLPLSVATSLKNNKCSNQIITKICHAQLLGWIAYSIYDGILDNKPDKSKLPLANISLREVSAIYNEISPKLNEVVRSFLNRIDSANFWEVTKARINAGNEINIKKILVDYKENIEMISDKSIGLALGPLAILYLNGYDTKSTEWRKLLEYLSNYIKAKQLLDDLHDWEDDLRAGMITKIVSDTLDAYEKKTGKDTINLEKDMLRLREFFWLQQIPIFSNEISDILQGARWSIMGIKVLDSTVFLHLLNSLQGVIDRTVIERKKMVSFLKAYKNK